MSKTDRSSISWMPHVWEAPADAVQRHRFQPRSRERLIDRDRTLAGLHGSIRSERTWTYIMFVEDRVLASKHVSSRWSHIKTEHFNMRTMKIPLHIGPEENRPPTGIESYCSLGLGN